MMIALNFGTTVKYNQPLMTKNGYWERLSKTEFRGDTTAGTVHVYRVETPRGTAGWEFRDRWGRVIAKLCAREFRGCTADRAIKAFDRKFLGGHCG